MACALWGGVLPELALVCMTVVMCYAISAWLRRGETYLSRQAHDAAAVADAAARGAQDAISKLSSTEETVKSVERRLEAERELLEQRLRKLEIANREARRGV